MEAFTTAVHSPITRRRLVQAAALSPLAYLISGCSESQQHRAPAVNNSLTVRVMVMENRPQVDLSAQQPPIVRVGNASPEQIGLSDGASVNISHTGAGWKIGNLDFDNGELCIEPAPEGSASVEGRAFRGKYRLVPRVNGKFDVINDIDVDGYLMGVIGKELYANWHPEAYRAQAVVARTYALYLARTGLPGAHYDLFADTRSQMYGGIAGESAKSRAAVEDTRGMVVAFGPPGEERIFKAYYSACCGGISQPVTIFGEPPLDALVEQNIGPRCSASTKFNWAPIVVSKSEITRRLRIWGSNQNAPEKTIGDVSHIDIYSTNRFGRPVSFTITDARGYRYRLGCEDLRLAINTDASEGTKLWSSFCNPINEPTAIRFADGHGLGHGVGMCQWCAEAQATAGVPYKQIVLGAFPKAVVVRAY